MITNTDAGTADEETLDRALASLFDRVSIEVTATSNPGELDGVLHRAGSRVIVVAGGDGSLHAVVAALHRRHDLSKAVHRPPAPRHGERLRPRHGDPPRHRGRRPGVGRRARSPGRPDRRRARRRGRQQRARRRRGAGQSSRPPLEGTPRQDRLREAQPGPRRLPHRRPAVRRQASVPPAPGGGRRRGGRRPRPAGADGRDRQRTQRRRRRRSWRPRRTRRTARST